MERVKSSDTIKVNYAGKLEDGIVFDTTVGHKPLEFMVGKGELVPGFKQDIIRISPAHRNCLAL